MMVFVFLLMILEGSVLGTYELYMAFSVLLVSEFRCCWVWEYQEGVYLWKNAAVGLRFFTCQLNDEETSCIQVTT